MLIFSRRIDEIIRIGDDIALMVVDIRGDKVRIGINAPSDIPVHRQEVYEAIQRSGQPMPLPTDWSAMVDRIRTLCLSRNNPGVNLGAHQLANDVLKIIGGA